MQIQTYTFANSEETIESSWWAIPSEFTSFVNRLVIKSEMEESILEIRYVKIPGLFTYLLF